MVDNKDKPIYIFKICLIGNGGTGKTCLARRMCLDTFDANTKLTIGIDFYTDDLPIIINGEESFVRLSIWDFGGQEQFKKMFSYYIHGANGVFLVFSLFNLNNSLLGLNWWDDHLSKILHKDTPKILVGCKSDLVQDPEKVDELVIESFRVKHDSIPFYKTSSKDNYNIHAVFLNMVESILKKNEFDYERIIKK